MTKYRTIHAIKFSRGLPAAVLITAVAGANISTQAAATSTRVPAQPPKPSLEIVRSESSTGTGADKNDNRPLTPSAPPSTNGSSSAKLLFHSRFEDGVVLSQNGGLVQTDRGKGRSQDLTGRDTKTGFSWPVSVLGGNPRGINNINGVFQNTIADGIGFGGSRGLKLSLQERLGGTAQTGIYVENATQESRYLRYKVKLPSDFARRMRQDKPDWRTIWFLKTRGDYRIAVWIRLDAKGEPYWMARGDNHANGVFPRPKGACVAWDEDGKFQSKVDFHQYWARSSSTPPVPQDGLWHTLEVFWNISKTQGRFVLALDGKTAIDYRGPTLPTIAEGTPYCNDPARRRYQQARVNRIGLSYLYGGGTPPVEQWVDDVEIWDRPPKDASIGL